MRADNAAHLLAATRRRAKQTRERAVAALRTMDATGTPITFEALARQARVSRSWLYTQDDLRTEIERLRRRHPSPSTAVPPQRQRASDTSLIRRLQTATDRIRHLEQDNHELRDALARALGHQRTDRITSRDTPGEPPTDQSLTH
jgi:hypothetical protein